MFASREEFVGDHRSQVVRTRWLRLAEAVSRTRWTQVALLASFGAAVTALGAPTTGDPVAGKALFSANCAGCHTLAAAGATGSGGPNLDTRAPTFGKVQAQVTSGGGSMPVFGGTLTETQIADLAAFVSQARPTPTPTPTPSPSPSPTPEPTPAPEPDPSPPLPTASAVTLTASRLALSARTLKAGRVTLTLRNRTSRAVRVVITVRRGRAVIRTVGPNATRAVTVILATGQRRVVVGERSVAIVAEALS